MTDRELGSIEVGERATSMRVDGDPLADIRALRRVRVVVAGGRAYDPATCGVASGFLHLIVCDTTPIGIAWLLRDSVIIDAPACDSHIPDARAAAHTCTLLDNRANSSRTWSSWPMLHGTCDG